jgi:phage gpG-like protein
MATNNTNKLEITFPKGTLITTSSGTCKIVYNTSWTNKFNTNLNRVQVFLDNKVITNLQDYVKYKTGTMAKSIRLASTEGSGYVTIGVPYAHYQAYINKNSRSKDIKRGARPFERMKADKKDTIMKQVAAYARRLNNG